MVRFLKILLLLIFVTAPTLDIALLDAQEPDDHFTESFHAAETSHQSADRDIHCNCHIIHHGTFLTRVKTFFRIGEATKLRPAPAQRAIGQHPEPGLHPPSHTLI